MAPTNINNAQSSLNHVLKGGPRQLISGREKKGGPEVWRRRWRDATGGSKSQLVSFPSHLVSCCDDEEELHPHSLLKPGSEENTWKWLDLFPRWSCLLSAPTLISHSLSLSSRSYLSSHSSASSLMTPTLIFIHAVSCTELYELWRLNCRVGCKSARSDDSIAAAAFTN